MVKSPNVKEEQPTSNLEDLAEEVKQETGMYSLVLSKNILSYAPGKVQRFREIFR